MRTGYHVIDAFGLDLNDLGKVTGLHDKCEKAIKINKPTFMENVANGDEMEIPIPVALLKASTSINIYAPTGNLVVAANDTVSALSEAQRERISTASKKAK